jgi:voltage-gated potassium channel
MILLLRRLLDRLRSVTGSDLSAITLSLLGLMVYGTLGFYFFEADAALKDQGSFQALGTAAWWSIVTMTTVGYGDFSPATFGGRWLVGVPLMVVGIGILGFAIGELTNWVIVAQAKRRRGEVPYTGEGHILILNFPGADLIQELTRELRADPSTAERDIVVVTDEVEEFPEDLLQQKILFVRGNPCREAVLENANLRKCHRVIILSQNPSEADCDSITLGVLVTVRALYRNAYVVVECQREENRKLLRSAGVDELVGAGMMRAELLVQGLQDPGINGVLEELLTNLEGNQMYLQDVGEFRGSYDELQEAVAPGGEYVFLGLIQESIRKLMPPGDTEVGPGNKMIVIGPDRPSAPTRTEASASS